MLLRVSKNRCLRDFQEKVVRCIVMRISGGSGPAVVIALLVVRTDSKNFSGGIQVKKY